MFVVGVVCCLSLVLLRVCCVMSGVLFSCVWSWPFRCCCLLVVGWCLSCGVVWLLLLVSLVVILRADYLRLALRVVADLRCVCFVRCVVRCLNLFVVVVIVCWMLLFGVVGSCLCIVCCCLSLMRLFAVC